MACADALSPQLDSNDPCGYDIERVWFDGRVVFASEQRELEVDEKKAVQLRHRL